MNVKFKYKQKICSLSIPNEATIKTLKEISSRVFGVDKDLQDIFYNDERITQNDENTLIADIIEHGDADVCFNIETFNAAQPKKILRKILLSQNENIRNQLSDRRNTFLDNCQIKCDGLTTKINYFVDKMKSIYDHLLIKTKNPKSIELEDLLFFQLSIFEKKVLGFLDRNIEYYKKLLTIIDKKNNENISTSNFIKFFHYLEFEYENKNKEKEVKEAEEQIKDLNIDSQIKVEDIQKIKIFQSKKTLELSREEKIRPVKFPPLLENSNKSNKTVNYIDLNNNSKITSNSVNKSNYNILVKALKQQKLYLSPNEKKSASSKYFIEEYKDSKPKSMLKVKLSNRDNYDNNLTEQKSINKSRKIENSIGARFSIGKIKSIFSSVKKEEKNSLKNKGKKNDCDNDISTIMEDNEDKTVYDFSHLRKKVKLSQKSKKRTNPYDYLI